MDVEWLESLAVRLRCSKSWRRARGRTFALRARQHATQSGAGLWFLRRVPDLNRLGGCRVPAILGLEDPAFVSGPTPDPERHKRYLACRLSLSELGTALLEGIDDFARHNPIHRWWGETLLTNANLWRWDAQRQRIVPPT